MLGTLLGLLTSNSDIGLRLFVLFIVLTLSQLSRREFRSKSSHQFSRFYVPLNISVFSVLLWEISWTCHEYPPGHGLQWNEYDYFYLTNFGEFFKFWKMRNYLLWEARLRPHEFASCMWKSTIFIIFGFIGQMYSPRCNVEGYILLISSYW